MGKQRGMYLHGTSENILYYSWKEIPCKRTIPAIVYQSPVVIAHKNANGLSTTTGASFRKLFAEVVPCPKNMKMQTAVRIALLKWLKGGPVNSEPPVSIPFISGLSFNETSLLKNCLKAPLTLALNAPDEFVLRIPEMIPASAFNAPPGTDHIHLKIAAACCDITTGEALQNYNHYITIPYNSVSIASQAISFSLNMPVNSLTMVVVALDYFTNKNGNLALLSNERFRPSEVIGGVIR
jgi:hypothetical protein